MKKRAWEGGVRVPKHTFLDKSKIKEDKQKYIKELEEVIGYPMFIKKISGSGGHGSSKATN